MVDVNKIIRVFNKKYPDMAVLEICDYDKSSYLVSAVDKKNREASFNDPYYLVNKSTASVSKMPPTRDRKTFLQALAKRTIYVSKE